MPSDSHVIGAKTPPLLEQTIGDALSDAARKFRDAPALVSRHQNIRWTYEELNARADALASGISGARP